MALLLLASSAAGQSSFESDPFASRFRERPNLDIKFRAPEAGGVITVSVSDGKGGRQSLLSENVYEVQAPKGGVVTLEYQDIKLTADYVRADRRTKIVVAEGDVVLEQGPSRLKGLRLELDLTDKTGVVTDGSAELAGIFVRGATLAKTGTRTFEIRDGALTACDGERPAWEFKLKDGVVTLDDYARLKKVVFELGGVPLLYTPYLLWPALRDRASGFMIPAVGYSSGRGGWLGLSYFQVLGRSADATVTTDLYTKKFFGLGTELRLRPSEGTTFSGTYYTVIDPNERWQWKTSGSLVADDLAPRTRAVVNWLQFSDLAFFQSYDRDFSLTSTRTVGQRAFVTHSEGPVALNLRLERETALYGATEVVLERKPVLEARLRPTGLFGNAVFVEAQTSGGFLRSIRPAGQPSGSYGRFDVFPKVSAPLSPLPWLSLNAEAGYRLTGYGASVAADGRSLSDDSYTRDTAVAGLELTGPSFARVFDVKWGKFTKLKHILEPRVDYQYQTDPGDLSRTPVFDEVDTILPSHAVRYSLVQRLLGKEKSGVSREIASLEVARLHYFELPVGSPPTTATDSPLDAILRVNAGPSLNFDARTTWDLQAGLVTSTSVSANVGSASRFLRFSYYDSRPVGYVTPSTQLRFGGGSAILPKQLRLDVEANYDIGQGRMLEWRSLLTWEASCFKILGEYRDLRIGAIPTKDFRIGLSLKNIGSFVDFTGRVSN
ncbi:MAG: LPS-assembly protein LptD [Holophagales bacterium]|nr:LPS-assembly protein LptD [Holophagales bacterium]MBK9963982.1 LPS-assembly protein LptD [Holophagales bacterium]